MGVTTSSTEAATYEPLITYTLSSTASSVTLGSGGQGTIPSTYTDLIMITNAKCNTGAKNLYYRLNSDTGSNYSRTRIYGAGDSSGSQRSTNATFIASGDISTSFIIDILQVFNYTNTNVYKTVLTRNNDITNTVNAVVGLWRSTSTINAITVYPSANNFASGSTFTLYGIKAA